MSGIAEGIGKNMKRNKILALVGALALTMSVAGVALATDLLAGQVGIKLSDKFDEEACADFPLEIGAGEVGVHFVLTGTSATSGLLDASFSTDSFTGLASTSSNGNTLHWYAVITGDGDTTLDSASTDATGDNLVLSHACAADVEPTPTFEQSEEAETDAPSFEQSQEAETDAPSEPQTDALGTAGHSGPADGAWLLVVALGVLLASIVVMTPAKAKGRR
jgi:hypothetical protein